MTPAPLTPRQLNRATLARQLLLDRQRLDPAEAVRRVVAIQAQAPASPYVGLWARLRDFSPARLDAALTAPQLVKATLMRITLHLVHADDHPELHAAMQPTLRAARLGDQRFTGTGLTPAHADALIPELLSRLASPHTNQQVEAWLVERLGPAGKWAWWALRHYAPVRHHPTGGPWSFGQRPAFVAADTPVPPPGDPAAADLALPHLVLRYLAGFGPATVADVAQFALVARARARAAITALGDQLTRYAGPGGGEWYDLPDAPLPEPDIPAPPRLLPMWDSVLLAYHDRSRVLPEQFRKVVIRNNGDVLPTVLLDGQVAGVWRTVDDGDGVEVAAFEPLPDRAWDALEAEAASLRSMLASRDPAPYGRYARWWQRLPLESSQVRVLTA